MDFTDSPSQVPREFQAVVLAGFGNELLPLTSDHGDEPCPKALLPIANKPMLDYPLAWLEESGIRDVLLICPTSHRAAISHHIHSSSSFASLPIDLQTFDESQNLSVGTCSVLRHFSHRLKGDFILLPCDFVPPPSLPLSTVLNKFRTESSTDGCILTTCWFEVKPPEKGASPDEWGSPTAPSPIVWDAKTGTLLHVDTLDDFDRNSDEIELRMALLRRYPRTILSSNLLDSHVYVCRRTVLDVLLEKPHMDSIREELIPWLCKIQYQRTKREKYGHVLDPLTNVLPQHLALKHSSLADASILTVGSATPMSASHMSVSSHALTASVPPSPTNSAFGPRSHSSLRVGIVVHRQASGYAARANNIHAYLELNRHFLTQTVAAPAEEIESGSSQIDPKAQISADTLVGDSSSVGPRTTIKKSVIGKHCVIGQMVKITSCVILDHCVVEDGAKLEGCLLGKNTKVGAKAKLTQCITQAGFEVEADGTYRNDKLEVSDWAAAPTSADDDAGDDDSDDESEED